MEIYFNVSLNNSQIQRANSIANAWELFSYLFHQLIDVSLMGMLEVKLKAIILLLVNLPFKS